MTSWRKPETDNDNNAVSLADIKLKYKEFAEPFRSANAWIPDGTPVYANRVTYWEPPGSWNNHGGKMSLAGDAAHPMTFRKAPSILVLCSRIMYTFCRGGKWAHNLLLTDRGQGLNHAITDAAKYVAALGAVNSGQESLKSGIGAYESEMIARGGEEVRLSKVNTEMVHDLDRLVQSPLFKMGIKRSA